MFRFGKMSSQSPLSEKGRQHWSYVVKVFEPIKNESASSINIPKPLRTFRASNCLRNPPLKRRLILNSTKETFNIKENIAIYEKNPKKQASERIVQEDYSKFQISWSSNDESDDYKENDIEISSNLSKHPEHSKDPQIVWSSSNESDESNDEVSVHKNNLSKSAPKISCISSECELDLFVEEIKKDLRRTCRRKQKQHIKKKGSLLEESRVAIEKGKSNSTFFNYEEEAGILKGLSAVVMEVNPSYGVYGVNVKLENSNQCCILLRDCAQSMKVGTSLLSFVDYSKKYVINGLDVFIQPNKIVES